MSEKGSNSSSGNGSVTWGIWGVFAVGLGGAFLVRMGYDLGIGQSKKILKRHDKDYRRMEKREKRYFREQRRKEKEEKRRNRLTNGWPVFARDRNTNHWGET